MKTLSSHGSNQLNGISTTTIGEDRNGLPATSRYAWPRPNTSNVGDNSSSRTFPSRASRNPFFARNSPHPNIVKHIKGLLDVPVCYVMNADMEEAGTQSRNSLSKPLLDQLHKSHGDESLTIPININAYRPREKAVPRIGLVPVTEDWRDQLRRLVLATGVLPSNNSNLGLNSNRSVVSRQQSRNASRSALRQLEDNYVRNVTTRDGNRPPDGKEIRNELVSRSGERPGTQHHLVIPATPASKGKMAALQPGEPLMEHITAYPDNEGYIFQILGRILQTDSVQAVQNWLVSAPDKERDLVVQMIKAVTTVDQQPAVDKTIINSPRNIHDPLYEDQLLQHESSLDIEEIKRYQEEDKLRKSQEKHDGSNEIKRNEVSAVDRWVRPGTAENDSKPNLYEWSVNSIANKPSTPFKSSRQAIPNTPDAEIEDIRSRLASRSNIRVFSHQSQRNLESRHSERFERNGTSNSKRSKGDSRQTAIRTVAPFSKED